MVLRDDNGRADAISEVMGFGLDIRLSTIIIALWQPKSNRFIPVFILAIDECCNSS